MKPVKEFTKEEVRDFILLCLRTNWTTLSYCTQMEADINAAIAKQKAAREEKLKCLEVSTGLAYLLDQETLNEKEGGVSPTTLDSVLDSLNQGLELEPKADTDAVKDELADLIVRVGGNTEASDVPRPPERHEPVYGLLR